MKDFHYGKVEYGSASIRKAIERHQLSDDDAGLILEFVNELFALNGISLNRKNKLIFSLVFWRKFLPEYRQSTFAELTDAISQVRVAKTERGMPYRQNTLHDHFILLKRFFIWLIENGYAHPSITLENIRRIKAPPVDRKTHSSEEILTEIEIKQLIKNAGSIQYRALISMLYEGGFRAKEIGTLAWNQVTSDQYGLAVRTDVKTGIKRYVRLIKCKKHFEAWKRAYPGDASGSNSVFLNADGNPLSHHVMLRQIRIIGQKAGITKKLTLHIFRHTRVTHLIKLGVREDVIKLMMWGSIKTEMLQTYDQISKNDIDEIVTKMEGVELKPINPERPLAPRRCQHCGDIVGPTFKYCGRCGEEM